MLLQRHEMEKIRKPVLGSALSAHRLMDIGRQYDSDVIRINSQSGKGGVAYILRNFGIDLPKQMREPFGYIVKDADKAPKNFPEDIYRIFEEKYLRSSHIFQSENPSGVKRII